MSHKFNIGDHVYSFYINSQKNRVIINRLTKITKITICRDGDTEFIEGKWQFTPNPYEVIYEYCLWGTVNKSEERFTFSTEEEMKSEYEKYCEGFYLSEANNLLNLIPGKSFKIIEINKETI